MDEGFEHHSQDALPFLEGEGKKVTSDPWGCTGRKRAHKDILRDVLGRCNFRTLCSHPTVRQTRLMTLGGETLIGPRYIWWNFIAFSKDRIEAAKVAWAAGDWDHGRFKLPPDDKDEFIL